MVYASHLLAILLFLLLLLVPTQPYHLSPNQDYTTVVVPPAPSTRVHYSRFQARGWTSRPSTSALYCKPKPKSTSLLTPFVDPRIDDIGLPLADTLIAGVVAPVSEVFICGVRRYSPSWLVATLPATSAVNNALRLSPATLSHGAILASCWLLGALASRSFEREAFDVNTESGKTSYSEVLKRVLAGGAFASGLLIVSTQADLFVEVRKFPSPHHTSQSFLAPHFRSSRSLLTFTTA